MSDERRKTCHGCQHLKGSQIPMRGAVFYCERTRSCVPHQWRPGQATFWRVPNGCPLPDTEVIKSDSKADQRDWVTIAVDRNELDPLPA